MAAAEDFETSGESAIDRDGVVAVEKLIRKHVRKTPVAEFNASDFGLPSTRIVLKLEQLQRSGSFKARGAFANLLLRNVPEAGVVAASGGNHGAAVACAAQALGVRAHIYVPAISSPAKIARIKEYGADLVVGGKSYADAFSASETYRTRSGALGVHAFDQRETILGAGTLGLELETQVPALDTILVAVGGGGLIAGIVTGLGGRACVIGVEPQASPTLAHALEAGRPVDAPVGGLAADSLAPRRIGSLVFPIAQRRVERVILVSDDDIRAAQRALWSVARIVAEPGGAAAFAAVLSKRYVPRLNERVAIVISGGNTTAVDFAR
jgi:threonine dehydratase